MKTQIDRNLGIPLSLVEAIKSYPLEREIAHCDCHILASPFDIYVKCPKCGSSIKVRSFSGVTEIEDVFDAVFEWMNNPGEADLVNRRQRQMEEDAD